MRGLLSVLIPSITLQRSRATYYQSKKSFVPAFVRRFFLRHPHAHLWIVLGLLTSAMIGPSMGSFYKFFTLTPEQFKTYQLERKELVRERAKYGNSLWIPFYSKGELVREESQQSD